MNASFSFEPLDFSGAQGVNDHHQGYGKVKHRGDTDYLCSEYGIYQDNTPQKVVLLPKDQQQSFLDSAMSDDFQFEIIPPPIQSDDFQFDIIPPSIQSSQESVTRCAISLTSLEILNDYRSGLKRLDGKKMNQQHSETTCATVNCPRLSTEEVMRIAGAQYIQFSIQKDDGLAMFRHPFGCALSGLSDKETKDVELAHLLLASAEKVEHQQFDRAIKLLNHCDHFSSTMGRPVQRVVYYFAEALREKINRETGRITLQKMGIGKQLVNYIEEESMSPNPAILAIHQELPFIQVLHFAGMQAIMDNMVLAKKIHVIDLSIRTGMHWTVLMQALASRYVCPLKLLKITAVGTASRHKIKETGKRLVNFAKTMNLPFSFKVVIVSDMKNLKEDLFELEADEAVAVYSPLSLRNMIARPDRLETLMRVFKDLNPCVMVVTEIEANHNSPSFVNRFIESLFFYSALFDCIETCMGQNNQTRMMIEETFYGQLIRNIIASDGEERTIRHVGIDVWRAFFTRFGLVETELSPSSLYQASLVVKQFAYGNSCTLDMNGKCLIVGWKGTPIISLSVWKFH